MSSQERNKERTSGDAKKKELSAVGEVQVTSSTGGHDDEPSGFNTKPILESLKSQSKRSECVPSFKQFLAFDQPSKHLPSKADPFLAKRLPEQTTTSTENYVQATKNNSAGDGGPATPGGKEHSACCKVEISLDPKSGLKFEYKSEECNCDSCKKIKEKMVDVTHVVAKKELVKAENEAKKSNQEPNLQKRSAEGPDVPSCSQ